MIKAAFTTLAIVAASSCVASAACFEDVYVPETLSCPTNQEKEFADFTKGGCQFQAGYVTQKEVECPGRWVNIYNQPFSPGPRIPNMSWAAYIGVMLTNHPTHAEHCASVGMKAANLDGQICASSRQRPNAGEGWSTINYVYGTSGGGRQGGTRFKQDYAKLASRMAGRGIEGGYCHTGSYSEFETYMAVAFYCSE